ncbi:MAG: TIGR01777 family oxidoreductase [Thermoleophilia bacterium]|nr:TIGR01777 family oxidoreductase [Thermoleophilia bacterium]
MPKKTAPEASGRTILVTGASGMIGSGLVNALIDRGDRVIGLSRNPDRASKAQPTAEWHSWEPTMERPPEQALDGVDAVINLAGEPINQRWNDEIKDRIARTRIKATKNLADTIATVAIPPKVFISGSAIGFYGDRGDELLYEDAAPGDDFLAGVVVRWEAAANAISDSGVRVATIRTGHVLDPRGGLLAELLTPFKLGVGGPIAGGDQYMSWIHRWDEIGILLWALDTEAVEGPINATSPNPVTNKEFSKQLGKAVGRPAFVPLPGFAMKAIRGPEFGQVLTEGQRVYPRNAIDHGYEFKQPELAGALAQLLRN